MKKFKCPRCLEESIGRRYHAACFTKSYQEERILKAAANDPKARRRKEKRKRWTETRMLALVAADKRTAAIARGVRPSSLHELDNAEVSWTTLLHGRAFN